jgi:site-specific DNA recombinase
MIMARISRRKDSMAVRASASVEKIYDTAIYARLSSEDNGVDGNSLDNQIYMLERYIEEKPDLMLCNVYSDNGVTGTNFDRPDFIRLMEDVRKGKVNCIIVKDLSRFGRNYIEAGNYLEKIFPYLGVRFISINDGYDSIKSDTGSDGLMISLKNLIYDIYAKDVSKKISDAYEVKQKSGQFIGDFAPYGYLKDQKDKHKLVINDETAPMVRKIYLMRLEGMGISSIVRKLNDSGIIPPRRYLFEKGLVKSEYYAKQGLWNDNTLLMMLQNPTYIGHLAQRKSTSAFYKGIKSQRNAPKDWVVVENTHDPIIDSNTFYTVQKIMEQSKQQYDDKMGAAREKYEDNTENVLKGFIICGDCGAKMLRRTGSRDKNGKIYAYRFDCPAHYRKKGFCSTTSIREDFILNGIYQAIKAQIKVAADVQKIIGEIVKSVTYRSKQTQIDIETENIRKKLKKLSGMKCSLYEDYTRKLMTENDYIYAKKKYEQDAVQLQEQLNGLLTEKTAFSEILTPDNKWMAAFKRFENEKEVTKEMLSELIVGIKVYGSQNIEITYTHQDEYDKLIAYIKTQNRTEAQAL